MLFLAALMILLCSFILAIVQRRCLCFSFARFAKPNDVFWRTRSFLSFAFAFCFHQPFFLVGPFTCVRACVRACVCGLFPSRQAVPFSCSRSLSLTLASRFASSSDPRSHSPSPSEDYSIPFFSCSNPPFFRLDGTHGIASQEPHGYSVPTQSMGERSSALCRFLPVAVLV